MPLEIAKPPVPADVEKEYSGLWVALRDGVVVASEADFQDLVANEHVRETDVLYHVPPAPAVI